MSVATRPKYLLMLVLSAGLAAMTTPASAATWGHLRGPFSCESQLRERANYAAEEREELRARWFVGYGLDTRPHRRAY